MISFRIRLVEEERIAEMGRDAEVEVCICICMSMY
jgi:hypothetical protein